jgi:hypothetical protein
MEEMLHRSRGKMRVEIEALLSKQWKTKDKTDARSRYLQDQL